MTKSQKDWWGRVRAKGRDHYIVHRGLLSCGIPCALLAALWYLWPAFFGDALSKPVSHYLIQSALLGLVLSWWFAATSWRKYEEEYQKPEESDDVVA
jgi:hypothetical protein